MGQPVGANGRGVLYNGMLDCFVKVRSLRLRPLRQHTFFRFYF